VAAKASGSFRTSRTNCVASRRESSSGNACTTVLERALCFLILMGKGQSSGAPTTCGRGPAYGREEAVLQVGHHLSMLVRGSGGGQRDVRVHAPGVDQAIRHDFLELSEDPHGRPVREEIADLITTADPKVDLGVRAGHRPRTPPLAEVLGTRPCLEDTVHRRSNGAAYDEGEVLVQARMADAHGGRDGDRRFPGEPVARQAVLPYAASRPVRAGERRLLPRWQVRHVYDVIAHYEQLLKFDLTKEEEADLTEYLRSI
jgi:hypothetical protein